MSRFGFETTAEEACKAFAKEINGKTILITGVSPGGMGAEVALAISLHQPGLLILAGRNMEKLNETKRTIKEGAPNVSIRLLELDLGSQHQIRKAAEAVNGYNEPIDRLINIASILVGPIYTSVNGLQSHFGVCYIGHFLFTNLIMPRILAARKGARVVNDSSHSHDRHDITYGDIKYEDYSFKNGASYEKLLTYAHAKTANILFSIGIATKLSSKGVRAYSLHPGKVMPNLEHLSADFKAHDWAYENRKLVDSNTVRWKTACQGAATHIIAAFDPSIAENHFAYLEDCHVVTNTLASYAQTPEDVEELWTLSEKLVGQKFEYSSCGLSSSFCLQT